MRYCDAVSGECTTASPERKFKTAMESVRFCPGFADYEKSPGPRIALIV
jgi:hypothetical protein